MLGLEYLGEHSRLRIIVYRHDLGVVQLGNRDYGEILHSWRGAPPPPPTTKVIGPIGYYRIFFQSSLSSISPAVMCYSCYALQVIDVIIINHYYRLEMVSSKISRFSHDIQCSM